MPSYSKALPRRLVLEQPLEVALGGNGLAALLADDVVMVRCLGTAHEQPTVTTLSNALQPPRLDKGGDSSVHGRKAHSIDLLGELVYCESAGHLLDGLGNHSPRSRQPRSAERSLKIRSPAHRYLFRRYENDSQLQTILPRLKACPLFSFGFSVQIVALVTVFAPARLGTPRMRTG
jgi:hypothetical protein